MSQPSVLQLQAFPGRSTETRHQSEVVDRVVVERLDARPALVFISAAARDVRPETFGLGIAFVILGPSVLRAYLVVRDGRSAGAMRRLRRWATKQLIKTLTGSQPLEVITLRDLFNYRAGLFTTTCYAGLGRFITAGLGRQLGLSAEAWVPARGFFEDGFTVYLPTCSTLDDDGKRRRPASPHRPPIRVKELGPHGVLAQFGRPPKGMGKRLPDGSAFRGRFLDIVPAGFALDGVDSSRPADHLEAFGEERLEVPAAVPVDPVGAAELLAVAQAIYRVALAIDDEAARWGLDPTKLYSPGTIAQAILDRSGANPPLKKFTNITDEALDYWASAHFGGHTSSELAGAGIFPEADDDMHSAYARIADAVEWWEMLTAAELVEEDATDEVVQLCGEIVAGNVEPLFDPATWHRLAFTICEVLPDGDELPADVVDDDHPQGGYRVRPINSRKPLFYAWPDIVLSALRIGRVPHVVSATRLRPVGREPGLRERFAMLDGETIAFDADPAAWLVRRRERAKDEGDERLDAQLQVVVNAMTCGQASRADQTPRFAGRRRVGTTEQVARWSWPPVAATLTAGCRLLLGLKERLAVEAGGTVAARDTDGITFVSSLEGGLVTLGDGRDVSAISWSDLDAVRHRFDPLSGGREFWSSDREHEGRPLHGVVLARKRYVFASLDDHGHLGEVVASTEHALADVEPPSTCTGTRPDGKHSWTLPIAERAFRQALGESDAGFAYPWTETRDGTPALVRSEVSAPRSLAELPDELGLHPFAPLVEALRDRFGSPGPRPVLPDPGGSLDDVLDRRGWIDPDTGRPVQLSLRTDRGADVVVATLEERARRWMVPRPEQPPGLVVVGLVRRVGRSGVLVDAGLADNEADLEGLRVVYEEEDLAGAVIAEAKRVGAAELTRCTGVPLDTARKLSAGTRTPSAKTIRRVLGVIPAEKEARRCAAGELCRHAEEGQGRSLIVRQRRWCCDACERVVARRARGIPAPHGRPARSRQLKVSSRRAGLGTARPRRSKSSAVAVGVDVACFACGEQPAAATAWSSGLCPPCRAQLGATI
jgi:hypothetical protein